MFTKIIVRAELERSSISAGAVLVVVLLSVLFAAAIVAATMPPPIGDAARAAIEGGL